MQTSIMCLCIKNGLSRDLYQREQSEGKEAVGDNLQKWTEKTGLNFKKKKRDS